MEDFLTVDETKKMFLYVGEQIIDSKSLLTEIDSAIGDGDHGIGMSKGFSEVINNLNSKEFKTINDIFKTIGSSMIRSMGGASGVIFGTMFMGGVKGIEDVERLTVNGLATIFQNSVRSIKERGKASLGDKTMIDALEPAVLALKECASSSTNVLGCLQKAEEKARDGVEKTKDYVAKFGRSKTLGERAIGKQDPGATSVWIIFKAMREWVERNH